MEEEEGAIAAWLKVEALLRRGCNGLARYVRPAMEEAEDKMLNLKESEPSISDEKLLERCFGAQSHGYVTGFGGGVSRKNLLGSQSTREKALLDALAQKEEENKKLHEKVIDLDAKDIMRSRSLWEAEVYGRQKLGLERMIKYEAMGSFGCHSLCEDFVVVIKKHILETFSCVVYKILCEEFDKLFEWLGS